MFSFLLLAVPQAGAGKTMVVILSTAGDYCVTKLYTVLSLVKTSPRAWRSSFVQYSIHYIPLFCKQVHSLPVCCCVEKE
uniref:Hypothetical secreted protein 1449 n=1 Tax=Amblyomma variegatum TaxID=34610 RepID=F0J9W0_AMBVA|nr:TPA_inf: hypothetical secreted protein 1449 [Amblyomma variegatum]